MVWWRGAWSAALGLLLGTAGACQVAAFACAQDSECENGGAAGTCQPTGFCSFPDQACESGQRYGEQASSDWAGQCVPLDPGEGSTSGVTDGTTSAGPGTTTLDPSASGTSTTGSATTSAVTDTDAGSGSTTDVIEPGCGDGMLDAPEACDDGNLDDADACNAWCEIPGSLLWSDTYHVTPTDYGNNVAVGPGGEIAVVGSVDDYPERDIFVRVYLDDAEAWTTVLDRAGNDEGWDIDFDRDGNIIVTGFSGSDADPEGEFPYVARFDAVTGDLLWEVVDDGKVGVNWGLTIGPDGDLYVCGDENQPSGWNTRIDQFFVESGQAGWSLTQNRATGLSDVCEGLAVDDACVYASGAGSADGQTERGWVACIDRSNGEEVWSSWVGEDADINGIWTLHLGATSLFFGGTVDHTGDDWQGFYGRMDPADGMVLDYHEVGGPGNDQIVTVLADSTETLVYVAGHFSGSGDDGFVSRISADIDWTVTVEGNGNDYDRVWGIALHPNGSVVAAGVVTNALTGSDAYVARIAR